jgi:putative MATE family efflux protein
MNAYNLTDTWFVSRLGTDALAAMSFTFPIVMLLRFIIRGLGTGAMTCVAHALGEKKHQKAAELTTHAFLLALIVTCVISSAGILMIKPLFMRLGASGDILALTTHYMRIWYCGLVVMSMQMLILDIIISTGNTKTVSLLVVSGTVLNFIFDPLLIFGLLGFPKMGIRGAALATVLAHVITLSASVYILHNRYHLITFSSFSRRQIFASWKRILHIGIPSTLSSMLTPLSAAVIIKIVADYGAGAVAACGVASRIEIFAFMVPMTIGVSLVPFVAQNYGAQRFDRIETARKGTISFALIFGFIVAALFLVIARPLAELFSKNPEVVTILTRYLYITCFGYGLLEAHRYAGFYMIGIHRPIFAAALNVIRVVVLLIPLALIGSRILGLSGVFYGRLLTDILAGIIGIIWSKKILRATMRKHEDQKKVTAG